MSPALRDHAHCPTAWLTQRVRHAQVVTEPPNGLRLNLRSSFSRISDATLAECAHPVRCLIVNKPLMTDPSHLLHGNKHAGIRMHIRSVVLA